MSQSPRSIPSSSGSKTVIDKRYEGFFRECEKEQLKELKKGQDGESRERALRYFQSRTSDLTKKKNTSYDELSMILTEYLGHSPCPRDVRWFQQKATEDSAMSEEVLLDFLLQYDAYRKKTGMELRERFEEFEEFRKTTNDAEEIIKEFQRSHPRGEFDEERKVLFENLTGCPLSDEDMDFIKSEYNRLERLQLNQPFRMTFTFTDPNILLKVLATWARKNEGIVPEKDSKTQKERKEGSATDVGEDQDDKTQKERKTGYAKDNGEAENFWSSVENFFTSFSIGCNPEKSKRMGNSPSVGCCEPKRKAKYVKIPDTYMKHYWGEKPLRHVDGGTEFKAMEDLYEEVEEVKKERPGSAFL